MRTGMKRRRVAVVREQLRYYAWLVLDCGHHVTRQGHFRVGQIVYCDQHERQARRG